MRKHTFFLAFLATGLAAADAAAPAPVSPWSYDLKLGVFVQNLASHNADTSRDPAINGANDNFSYKASADGKAVWEVDKDRVEQRLLAEYGRVRTRDAAWQENADRILYGGSYERSLNRPHLMYLSWETETRLRGPEPERHPHDPILAKASGGYGERFEGWLPVKDSFVWRIGTYVSKRWERGAEDYIVRVHTGPEAYLRYERQQSADVSYYMQWEAYSEYRDLGHIVVDGETALTARVGKSLSVVLKARAYYETQPGDAADDAPGYSQWSLREEALIGLLWTFSSAAPE